MIQAIIVFTALFLSIFYSYDEETMNTIWWESHIPSITIMVLLLLTLLIPKRIRICKEYTFSLIMCVISLIGIISIFFCDIHNSSIYSMGVTLTVPSIMYFLDTKNKTLNYIIYIVLTLYVIVVIYSSSRTGIIVTLLSFIYFLWNRFKSKCKLILFSFISLSVVFIVLVFFVKENSSNGRAFILKNTAKMILEKPFGWGTNGFETNYMVKQAEYFCNNNDEEMEMLADDIKHPLNEFMYIAINHGIHVLAIFVTFVFLLIYLLYKRGDRESKCFLHFIILLFAWCCFSYPLSVSFVIVILSAYIISYPMTEYLLLKRNHIRYTIILPLLLCGCKRLQAFNDERIWNNAIETYNIGRKEDALMVFDNAHNFSIDKGRKLFSLATIEYNNKDYKRCIEVCNECKQFIQSYDLELMHANCYMFIGNQYMALKHFQIAHNMCPVRFIPLYKQFKIYKEIGDTLKMIKIGKEILSKKVKVYSYKTNIIINNVQYELKNI